MTDGDKLTPAQIKRLKAKSLILARKVTRPKKAGEMFAQHDKKGKPSCGCGGGH